MARETGVGRGHPYSNEKLGPILAFYVGKDYKDVCDKVCEILHYEGAGHTFSMHTQAALTIASAASMELTRPLVSIMPSACIVAIV